MRTDTFRGRDFITLLDWSKEEVEQILDLALELKRDRASGGRTTTSCARKPVHDLLQPEPAHPQQL